MSTLENNTWKELTQDFNSDLHNVLLQQHHAAQFIALVGRHMIPQQANDSNTNMRYLAGREIPLSGLNKEQVFEQLKKSLAELDLDVTPLKNGQVVLPDNSYRITNQ